MKPITEKQMLELIPADAQTAAESLAKFEAVISTRFWKRGDCERMISEGWIDANTVRVAGEDVYLLGTHRTDDAGLWVDIALGLSPRAQYPHLVAAIELLATNSRCRYVRFYTARRGIIACVKPFGYEPEAVLLTKEIAA